MDCVILELPVLHIFLLSNFYLKHLIDAIIALSNYQKPFTFHLSRKLRHIMIHLRLIIAPHRTTSIKQSSQQICLNIANLSSILSHAYHCSTDYILGMKSSPDVVLDHNGLTPEQIDLVKTIHRQRQERRIRQAK